MFPLSLFCVSLYSLGEQIFERESFREVYEWIKAACRKYKQHVGMQSQHMVATRGTKYNADQPGLEIRVFGKAIVYCVDIEWAVVALFSVRPADIRTSKDPDF